ncbi:MAG: PAS domain S-box protein [Chitinophagaceae bacterium]|nr:PAS domain S-box protein [Chitinophagaceae bacterium]
MNLHKLIQKQIKKYLPQSLQQYPELQEFLLAINDSYCAYDKDKELSERAFKISEEEYVEINSKLKQEIAVKKQSLEKLKETIGTITGEEKTKDSDDLLMIARYLDQQVNDRKCAEDKLKTSQELWHFALEGTGDGVWEYDAATKEVFFSRQFKKMLGYEEDEFGNNKRELISRVHPEDRPGVVQTGKDYIRKKITSHQREYRLQHKDGHYIWVLDRGRVFKSTAGAGERVIGTNTDITERKKTEEEYKRISVVASANENGVLFTGVEGKISWTNQGFVNLTKYTKEEIIGKTPFDLCKGPLSDRGVLRQMINDFEQGRSFNSELIHYRKDGTWFWGRSRGQAVTDEKGKVIQYFAMVDDISGEKAAQKKLKEYEERFKIALSNVGDNYWEHNFKTGKTFFSNALNNILGYSVDEFTDEVNLWWTMTHEEDRKILEENDANYKAGLIYYHNCEYRVFHKDGTVHWILDRGVVTEKNDEGKPVKIIGTHIDITRQKELEFELSQRVKQFKSLSENIPGVIYEFEFRKDGTEGLRYVSPAMAKIFGIGEDEFYQFQKYIHPDDIKEIEIKRKHSRTTLESFHAEARLLIPGNGIIWYSVTSSFSYRTPEGSAVFTGFMLNITERKNADQALKVNEEKYRNIIANMNLGLLEVDNHEIIRSSNHSFCEMSGYDMDDLIGKKASDLFIREGHTEMMEMRNESRKKGVSDAYEIAVKNKSGESKWWLISGAPRYNDEGELLGSIGIHLDITAQKILEYELLEAREHAELSASAKQTFLANMSHEIRTPMNAILGMSRQLQKTILDETQQLYLNTINNAGEHLMVIINDILDISKIEAGKLELENIGFSIKEVVKSIVDVMQHRASEKGILVNCSTDENIAGILKGDPFRLKQILFNLVSNAVKFSEKGIVSIDCILKEQHRNCQSVQISVADNGIGMDKEFMNNLFQSFTQEDKSVSRKFGGTGLGMTITKQLSELMGGHIHVQSEKNVGSTITLIIPFVIGNENDLPAKETRIADESILKDKQILLVEDNEMNRLVAIATLAHYGAKITEAVNGIEAVQAMKTLNFDLVLMDMQMPEMDGLEATRIIRKEVNAAIPIIALTANAIKGESDKCFAAGMDDFISKPFAEEALVAMIAKWLGKEVKIIVAEHTVAVAGSLYDLSKMHEISKTNESFLKKLIALFIELATVTMEEMVVARQKNDFAKIKALAHSIKPSIDNMGIHSLKEGILRIEALAIKGESCDELDRLIDELNDTLQIIVLSLQNDLPGKEKLSPLV